MYAILQEWAARRGYRVAVGDLALLAEVRTEIEGRAAAGEFEGEFFRVHLSRFRYGAEDESFQPSEAKVVLLAVPRPAHRIVFRLREGTFEVVLPPTYLSYRELFEELRAELAALLGGGIRLAVLNAPLKAVAVRLGLAAYGRNNLAYVSGMGSYHQLVGFLVEGEGFRPVEARPPQLLPACKACQACRRACPLDIAVDENPNHPECVRCLDCTRVCPTNALRFGTALAPGEGAVLRWPATTR